MSSFLGFVFFLMWALSGCGEQPTQHSSHLRLLGSEVLHRHPPWAVNLSRLAAHRAGGDALGSSWCGGAYIHPGLILTAAHCIIPPFDHRRKDISGADDLPYRRGIVVLFHQGSEQIMVRVKRFLALGKKSDLALLFFDQEAFAAQIEAKNLTLPQALPLFRSTQLPRSGEVSIYGVGKIKFLEGEGPCYLKKGHEKYCGLLSFFVKILHEVGIGGKVKMITTDTRHLRLGGVRGKDRITVELNPHSGGPPVLMDFATKQQGFFGWLSLSFWSLVQQTSRALGKVSDEVQEYVQNNYGKFAFLKLPHPQAACGGDSGSPITVVVEGREYLLGIHSAASVSSRFFSSYVERVAGLSQPLSGLDLSVRPPFCGDVLWFTHLAHYITEIQQAGYVASEK